MNVILSTESVDVVVTSPPYNIEVSYHTYNDSLPRENYLRWISDGCAAIKHILKPNGSFSLNIGTKPTIPSLPFEVALCLERVETTKYNSRENQSLLAKKIKWDPSIHWRHSGWTL